MIACAIGTRARPQKNSSAIAAVIAPRIRWSRIPLADGFARPLTTHAAAASGTDVPVRHTSALYTPSASVSDFMNPSINENSPMPAAATPNATAGER